MTDKELTHIAKKLFQDNADTMLNDIIFSADFLALIYNPETSHYEILNLPKGFGEIPRSGMEFPHSIIKYLRMSDEHREQVDDAVQKMKNGEPDAEVIIEAYPGGDGKWMRQRFINYYDDRGNSDFVFVYAYDITNRKIKEKTYADQMIMRKTMQGAILVATCVNATQDTVVKVDDSEETGFLGKEPCSDKMKELLFSEEPSVRYQNPETQYKYLAAVSQLPDEEERRKFGHMCSHVGLLEAFQQGKTEQVINYTRTVDGKNYFVSTRIVLTAHPETRDVYAFFYTTDITHQRIDDMIVDSVMRQDCDFVALIDSEKETAQFRFISDKLKGSIPEWCATEELEYSSSLEIAVARFIPEKLRKEWRETTSISEIVKGLAKEPTVVWSFPVEYQGQTEHKQVVYRWLKGARGKILAIEQDVTVAWNKDRERERQEREQNIKNQALVTDNAILQYVALESCELISVINLKDKTAELRHGTWFTVGAMTPEDKRKSKLKDVVELIRDRFLEGPEKERFGEVFEIENLKRALSDKNEVVYVFNITKNKANPSRKLLRLSWLDKHKGLVLMSKTDVSELYRKEQQLSDALIMAEQSSQAKSDFLSRMSHDVRTPLNAIIGYSMLIRENAGNPEKIREEADKILLSSNHLLGLINDVLDMSRIEAGRMKVNPREFNLTDVLETVDNIVRPQMEDRDQTFIIDTSSMKQVGFVADDTRIQQILINVLTNATKYTPKGGRIWLKVEGLEAVSGQLVNLKFEITDNGRGMSEEFQQKLFSPFVREELEGQDLIAGTGLGLAITKNLVNLLGGTVSVKSKLGFGSTFIIVIPATACTMLEEEIIIDEIPGLSQEETDDNVLNGLRILTAEDNDLNAEIITEILKMNGAKVEIATDGQKAVDIFKNSDAGTYDLIFMDVQMPIMNGYDATRAIRELVADKDISKVKRHEAERIPIIAMTANAFNEDVQKSFLAGMDGHISKPVNLERIKETVRKVLP